MSSNRAPRIPAATVATRLRSAFTGRGERSRPTRPRVEHPHERLRFQPPPLV
ncbi:MAG: hypothetical protein ACXV3V_06200 [Actinomycetes bacterium]